MKKLFSFLTIVSVLFAFSPLLSFAQDTNNVVLEECTGTWCGYCPCGHQIIETIHNNYPNTIFLCYHGPLNYGNPTDPWAQYSSSMISMFGFNSFPTAVIGRTSGIVNRGAWLSYVSLYSTQAPGVKIEVTDKLYNSSTRTMTCSVKVTALSNLVGNHNISFVLTEDRLVYPQNVYAACGTAGIQNDYIHNYVVKGVINGSTGQQLFDSCSQGQIFTVPFSYVIPAGFAENNCTLNMFVFKNTAPYTNSATIQNGYKVAVSDFPTGIAHTGTVVNDYKLGQNYPNPFNPTTNIKFNVPKNTWATFKIYDMLGKEVATYLDHYYIEAGEYNVEFNGANLPSGIYFYKLMTKDFTDIKKMSLVK